MLRLLAFVGMVCTCHGVNYNICICRDGVYAIVLSSESGFSLLHPSLYCIPFPLILSFLWERGQSSRMADDACGDCPMLEKLSGPGIWGQARKNSEILPLK